MGCYVVGDATRFSGYNLSSSNNMLLSRRPDADLLCSRSEIMDAAITTRVRGDRRLRALKREAPPWWHLSVLALALRRDFQTSSGRGVVGAGLRPQLARHRQWHNGSIICRSRNSATNAGVKGGPAAIRRPTHR
jgi:hypothetical protein